MGWPTRWLRNLFTHKKAASDIRPTQADRIRIRKKWVVLGKSLRHKPDAPPPSDRKNYEDRNRNSYMSSIAGAGDPDEQNKHAIAVAAATAAVAEAAVAAAHAAAAVVRLTSSGRCVPMPTPTRTRTEEELAAINIQSAFRAYLARRALKALRGLVKLQALVRGFIVRKQAAETLRCMHALLRVQTRARSCRALQAHRSRSNIPALHPNPVPPTPEKCEHTPRSNASRSDHLSPLKSNSTKSIRSGKLSSERSHSSGHNWLDQWIEEKYWDDARNDKILQVDPGIKPKNKYGNSGKQSNPHNYDPMQYLSSSTNISDPNSVQGSPSKDSTAAQLSIPVGIGIEHSLRFPIVMTSVNLVESPQFYSATSRATSVRRGPFTSAPAKSECSFGGYTDYPNYMANTESFKAKARSQSAPKQRPEHEKLRSGKRVLSAFSIEANSFAKKGYPGSGKLDRLGMPIGRY